MDSPGVNDFFINNIGEAAGKLRLPPNEFVGFTFSASTARICPCPLANWDGLNFFQNKIKIFFAFNLCASPTLGFDSWLHVVVGNFNTAVIG